jgi:hypothetical protein
MNEARVGLRRCVRVRAAAISVRVAQRVDANGKSGNMAHGIALVNTAQPCARERGPRFSQYRECKLDQVLDDFG